MRRFPAEIQDLANMFIAMQKKRQDADYDPAMTFYKSEIEADIKAARAAMASFKDVRISDRRAFAAHISLSRANR